MNIETLLSFQWQGMLPEFVIIGMATIMTMLDLFLPSKKQRSSFRYLSLMATLTALVLLVLLYQESTIVILYDTFVLDEFAKIFKLLLLIGASFVILTAPPKSEFFYFILMGLLGAMIISSSGDLMTLFIGLELLTLSSVLLVAFNRENLHANEAAIKLFLNAGVSTAITLFGMSYLYGITGSTNLQVIASTLLTTQNSELLYLSAVSFLIIFVGLTFKIGAFPFQMWVADVYQGSSISSTLFLNIVSKTAGFILFMRLFLSVYEAALLENQVIIGGIACVTMLIGNIMALRQTNVKRMLAYSSIGHGGYILAAFSAFQSPLYIEGIWFYLFAYLFMTTGAFVITYFLSNAEGHEEVSLFAGLGKKSPLLAILMTIFLLSLAAIPGTSGFIGKFAIFLSVISSDPAMIMIASVMVMATIISYAVYFRILEQIFFNKQNHLTPIKMDGRLAFVTVLCSVATCIFGLFPNLLYSIMSMI
ncbi:NADH-quinone oxidoreductase subunit N [Bacillus carboniphilus]|uniref:NADH-quinone oxidoreductase subunit N n=1 Tax=Bacillus carboniphilus TaxID=86663 RepID=A0ABY9JVF8_9BACI|nr:NADH-quinone oxidoreductase subunit N [Bacillus carboniphilus]WLR41630.1 NADH-quinone oxidoreductase subunit N [Bacillus carboniphilus]